MVDNITSEIYQSDYAHTSERDYRIALLIDGSVTETSTTGTGPSGNYCGSMRKDNAYLTQRAIYSRYKNAWVELTYVMFTYRYTLYVWSVLHAKVRPFDGKHVYHESIFDQHPDYRKW